MQLSFIIIEVKILNQILAKRIKLYVKELIHHDQVGFIQKIQVQYLKVNVC